MPLGEEKFLSLLLFFFVQAQAVMLLAGSGGLPQTQNNILSTGQVKASFAGENFQGMPHLELSTATKPIKTSASHPKHSETPIDACSVAPVSPIPPTFIPAGINPFLLYSTPYVFKSDDF